jgi:hypothetical protein
MASLRSRKVVRRFSLQVEILGKFETEKIRMSYWWPIFGQNRKVLELLAQTESVA